MGFLSRGVLSVGLSATTPRLWRGPVYPAFVALTEAPFPAPWASHPRLALALLSALAVGFAFWLGAFLGGEAAGWAAALLLAFDPSQILSAASLNAHGFYGLALLGLAGAAAWWAASPGAARGIALGFALGGTLLIRSSHVLAVPLVLAAGSFRGDGWRRAARRAAWPAAALLAALLPWTVRNAVLFGTFQPLDAYSGAVNLYAASRGRVQTVSVEEGVALAAEQAPEIGAAYESDHMSVFPALLTLAKRNIAADPLAYARGCALRFRSLFVPWLPALAAALFAAWRLRSRAAWAALAVPVSLAAYAGIAVQAAYGDALRPAAALFFGLAAACLPPGPRKAAPAERARAASSLAFVYGACFATVFVFAVVLLARESVGTTLGAAPGRGTRAERLMRQIAARDATGQGAYQLGVALSAAGRSAEACGQFRRAAAFAAARDAARPALVECLAATGRGAEALAAADAWSRSAATGLERGAALASRAVALGALGRRAEAERELAKAAALAPESPGVRRALLTAAIAAGRWTEAEARLTAAVASASGSERADLGAALASARWRRGADEDARRAFAAALADDAARACRPSPNLVDPGELPSVYFDECLRRLPGDARLLADRGVALWREKRPAGAIASLRAAVAAAPGDLAAALSLAAALGPGEEARAVLAKALAASAEKPGSPLRLRAESALKEAR